MHISKYNGGDKQLLLDIKDSKNDAWRHMYLQYQPMVIGIVTKNSGGLDEGEDLFQEVLIDFRQNIIDDKLREDNNIRNYIYTLAKNRWFVLLRKKGIVQAKEIIDDMLIDDTIEMNFDQDALDLTEELKSIIKSITAECKDLMMAKYAVLKKSMEEIATLLGYKDSRAATVKLNKCMTKARELGKEVLRRKEEL